MATIVNEGTKDYRVTRNSIYVGSVVKLKNGSKLTDDLSIVNCEKYRTILFSKNEDNNAVDLLYKSPLYPIFGYNDNIDQDSLFVTGACSLEEILEFYGFNYLLYYDDAISIKNIYFSDTFLKHNLRLFGITKKFVDETCVYPKDKDNDDFYIKLKFIVKSICSELDENGKVSFSHLYQSGKLPVEIIDAILEARELSKYQTNKKSFISKCDSFTPVKEEGIIKKLRYK